MHENPVLKHYKYPETLAQAMQNAIDYLDVFLIRDKRKIPNRIVYLTLQIKFSTKVSNTHNAPIGGETNWWWKDNLKKGYPGWSGTIWFATEKALIYKEQMHTLSAVELLKKVCIHTGTGGGGNDNGHPLKQHIIDFDKHYKWRWSGEIFLDDFPSIKLHALIDPSDPETKLERQEEKQFTIHIVNSDFDTYSKSLDNTYITEKPKRIINVYQ